MSKFEQTTLGRTGLKVGRLGIGSSYGVGAAEIEWAVDQGVTYLYWGSARRPGMRDAIRSLARKERTRIQVVVQSYTRLATLMEWSLDRALRDGRIDHADVLLLGWWNGEPPARIADEARRLKEKGKVRFLALSSHHRPFAARVLRERLVDVLHVRYNAAHRGAEKEVFPVAKPEGPGIVTYTTTRWGSLLRRPKGLEDSVPVPSATDCYQFALTNPVVDVVICGPANRAQLDTAVAALKKGPMSKDRMEWMHRVGDAVHQQPPSYTWFMRAVSALDLRKGASPP